MASLFTSSSQSSRGARASRKLHLLALAVASIRPASALILSGCYSSPKPLTYSARWNYQSPSWCDTNCAGSAVFGLEGGFDCWCGSELPPADTEVDESNCNVPCTGYGQDACGGNGFYTVYITGTNPNLPHYNPGGSGNNNGSGSNSNTPSSDTPSSTASASTSSNTPLQSSTPVESTTTQISTSTTIQNHSPSVVTKTKPGNTIIKTVKPSTLPSNSPTSSDSNSNGNSSGGTSVAGIAAGVSVGVVALAAIVGGIFYYLRRRRQQIGAFDRSNRIGEFLKGPDHGGAGMGGGSRQGDSMPPPSTAYSQMSDSRLEPQLGGQGALGGVNRSSVGSFMDDQDYSRRILRVANPDSS